MYTEKTPEDLRFSAFPSLKPPRGIPARVGARPGGLRSNLALRQVIQSSCLP